MDELEARLRALPAVREACAALAGRLLLAALFLPAGLAKLTGFAGTVGYIASVGLPLPTVAAAVAVVLEIGAGLALIAGFGTRAAALVLAVFTLAATVIFHAYWAVPPEKITGVVVCLSIWICGSITFTEAWAVSDTGSPRIESLPFTEAVLVVSTVMVATQV